MASAFWRRFFGVRSTLPVGRRLRLLRFLLLSGVREGAGTAQVDGLRVAFTDGQSLAVEYKDIFLHEIYAMPPLGARPVVIDAGACIGMFALWIKRQYPDAQVRCFEPDAALADVLQRNLSANNCGDVAIERVALGATDGEVTFTVQGGDAGRVAADGGITVPLRRLSPYLSGTVDVLKMNIEGQELGVVRELAASGALARVRNLTIEYHGWQHGTPCLGALLSVLEEAGFTYVVHDFDHLTSHVSKPPYAHFGQAHWFCLVVARRPTQP
jgi:FkbM family methyltransferase